MGRVIAELTADIGNEPQWYLHLIAVRPEFMSQGYSSRLALPILAQARVEGLPCTLITQSAENVCKYEHLGIPYCAGNACSWLFGKILFHAG